MADAHQCHAHGCEAKVPERDLMCPRHWYELPKEVRAAIWREHRPGQEATKTPTLRYLAVQRFAVGLLARRHGHAKWADAYQASAEEHRARAASRGMGDALEMLSPVALRVSFAPVPCLSVRQPWAWAIFHADKDVENRDWASCRYRGSLAIHAGLGCTRDEYASAVESIGLAREDLGLPPVEVPPLADLPRGGLVGAVRLAGARRNNEFEDGSHGYRVSGALGLELADAAALPFVACKGQLNFFRVDLSREGASAEALKGYRARFPGEVTLGAGQRASESGGAA